MPKELLPEIRKKYRKIKSNDAEQLWEDFFPNAMLAYDYLSTFQSISTLAFDFFLQHKKKSRDGVCRKTNCQTGIRK